MATTDHACFFDCPQNFWCHMAGSGPNCLDDVQRLGRPIEPTTDNPAAPPEPAE